MCQFQAARTLSLDHAAFCADGLPHGPARVGTGSSPMFDSPSPGTKGAETQSETTPRVLIVEDNPEIRIMMSLTLESDFEVGTAATFDQAMEEAMEHTYDVLLVDIDLGGQRSGVDLVRELRAEGYKNIPMIACTAYALPGDRERFLNEGFDDYIGKPFTRNQLIDVLRRSL